ncbi:hypothetical protein C0030_000250 [Candidatus Liberibacter solanacearum]|uniref:Uncharacterized protein n=1 Tax=Candidatus Liberibacter solanacearum TaxID=556287 RepID=A0A424FNY8_9HYPH|nr:hypothetical protein C0030_000250 [Candidatus Liberibacter solanacearum]
MASISAFLFHGLVIFYRCIGMSHSVFYRCIGKSHRIVFVFVVVLERAIGMVFSFFVEMKLLSVW